MIMKTKDGKIVQVLSKDDNGFCYCDDGWKRPISELLLPTKEEILKKRSEKKVKY